MHCSNTASLKPTDNHCVRGNESVSGGRITEGRARGDVRGVGDLGGVGGVGGQVGVGGLGGNGGRGAANWAGAAGGRAFTWEPYLRNDAYKGTLRSYLSLMHECFSFSGTFFESCQMYIFDVHTFPEYIDSCSVSALGFQVTAMLMFSYFQKSLLV